jgi:hypothetical protein
MEGGIHGSKKFDDLNEEERKELNERSKPENEDLLPWEREENRIEKSQIKKFIDSHKKNESLDNHKKILINNKDGKNVHNNDEICNYCCECCLNCF